MRHTESKLQQHCFRWFRYQYPEYKLNYIAIPNGGRRDAIESSIMKGEGVTAGAADSVLFVPSAEVHGLCIEFKQQSYTYDENGKQHIHKTYQRKEQKEWQEAVEKSGYRYEVIRTFGEFVSLIEEYLGKKY